MKIYVLHYKPAKERKEKLIQDFTYHGLIDNVVWIENYDAGQSDYNEMRKHFPPLYKKSEQVKGLQGVMSPAEVSLYYKHYSALADQLYNNTYQGIVMEDDIIIPKEWNMQYYLEKCWDQFYDLEGDILNIGTAFNMEPTILKAGQFVYHEPHFTTRCAHCYAIAPKALNTVLYELDCLNDAYDWKLNDIIATRHLKSCYVNPGLKQGSIVGTTKSLLR